MGFDANKHLVGKGVQEVSLMVGEDELLLKVRDVPWSKRNQIISQALSWDSSGTTRFDGDLYIRECLKYMVVEAPWGQTTEIFLTQVDEELGKALEALVPKAFAPKAGVAVSVDEIKKGS